MQNYGTAAMGATKDECAPYYKKDVHINVSDSETGGAESWEESEANNRKDDAYAGGGFLAAKGLDIKSPELWFKLAIGACLGFALGGAIVHWCVDGGDPCKGGSSAQAVSVAKCYADTLTNFDSDPDKWKVCGGVVAMCYASYYGIMTIPGAKSSACKLGSTSDQGTKTKMIETWLKTNADATTAMHAGYPDNFAKTIAVTDVASDSTLAEAQETLCGTPTASTFWLQDELQFFFDESVIGADDTTFALPTLQRATATGFTKAP